MQKIHFLVGDKSVPLSVEVKRSPESIRKGLMHRKEPLEKDTGALFDLGVDADHGFWMKNTFIPLDMIFVDNNMKVVGIVHNAKPLTTKSRRVGKNSRYVVEVNAGWAKKNGIIVGTKLSSHMSKTASEKYKQVPFKGGYVRVKIKDKQGNHLQHHFVRVNRWGLPAGGIEKGETPRQAAARELLERTGYKIDEAALRPAGRDSKGFYIFEGDKKNTRVVAKPGQLGGYSTKVKWGGPNETSHSTGQKTAKLEHKPEPTRDSPEGKELLRIRGILRKAQMELGEGTSVFLVAGSNKYPGIGGEVTKGSARDPYIASHAKLHERWSAQQGYSKWGKKPLPQTGPNKSGPSNVARHTRKLKSGKRVEVKPHTRRKSGKLEERYPEIKFKRQTGRIREALKMKARRGYSTQNESLHIKYGPKVHFGVGRHGAHFGVYGKGPATHFYQDKVYVGNAKKGKTYTLSKEQRQRVAKLMQDRRAKQSAKK